jgi:hypothetical protein
MGAKALFIDVLYCSKLALQSVGLITQTAVKRRRAKSFFKKTLITQGITPQIAKEIAETYPDPITEIFSIIKDNAWGLRGTNQKTACIACAPESSGV